MPLPFVIDGGCGSVPPAAASSPPPRRRRQQPRATPADLEAVGLRRLSDNLQRLLDLPSSTAWTPRLSPHAGAGLRRRPVTALLQGRAGQRGCRSSASSMAENAGARGAKEAVAWSGKRVALGNLTNIFRGGWRSGAANTASDAKLSSTKPVDVKKGSFACLRNVNTERCSSRRLASDQFDEAVSLIQKNTSLPSVPYVVSTGCSSPGLSQDCSVSMEDAMSICNSTESSDLECLNDDDLASMAALILSASMFSLNDDAEFNERKHSPNNPLKVDNVIDLD